jgi:sulfur carrier protein ThiS
VNPSNPTQESRLQETVTVIPAGCTVAEFIEDLAKHLGGDFRRALLEKSGRLHADYAIVLNKQFIPPGQIAAYKIRNTCDISIIPIAGGG